LPPTSKNASEEIRDYAVWEIEEIADRLLAKVFPVGLTIPIEIEDAASLLGLEIVPIAGLKHACGVLGVLWLDPRGKFWIAVDEHMMDYQESRHRFTVAEELAHYCLHKTHIGGVRDIAGALALQQKLRDKYSYVEANTRRLAEALLMPRTHLLQDAAPIYARVVQAAGYRNLEAVRTQVVDLLARRYGVSFTVMKLRLQHKIQRSRPRIHDAIQEAFQSHTDTLWESP
jgi:hypothetical protein